MKLLLTDEQTVKDLELFGHGSHSGVYDLYNRAHTRGGELLLQQLFREPMSDKDAIRERIDIIEAFAALQMPFPFSATLFDQAEKYLNSAGHDPLENKQVVSSLGQKEMAGGVEALINLLQKTAAFIADARIASLQAYRTQRESIGCLLEDAAMASVLAQRTPHKLSYAAVTAYDTLFRVSLNGQINQLMKHIYYLDVCISVGTVAREGQMAFPRPADSLTSKLSVKGVYHPSLKNPVGNDIEMDAHRNIIFLTGANMAGKSTFLRSLSTALYLAHMGFPVPARSMHFSILDALYTTINLPDNLGIGASHFYAEVLRVKKMAQELNSGKSCFILFDELFRGTNVKDAYEATVAVMQGFARQTSSFFLISSHIVEAGAALSSVSQVAYRYLPTVMKGPAPEYTYRLENGVTDDRHGMVIIRNEGVLDILRDGLQSRQTAPIPDINHTTMHPSFYHSETTNPS